MDIRLLTDLNLIKQIYDTYLLQDFPENERTPWKYLNEMYQNGEYDFYGLYENGEFVGYAFFIRQIVQGEKYFLLDYFSVLKSHRDEGIGSQFLKKIGPYISNADCVVIEVEDPDAAESEEEREIRQRRIRFYERNGVHVTDAKGELRGVVYLLLEIPVRKRHSPVELKKIYASIYYQFMPEDILKKIFRLLP